MPAGLSFREGKAGTHFEDANPFLPHVVKTTDEWTLNFELTKAQNVIRKKLYNNKHSTKTEWNIYAKNRGSYDISVLTGTFKTENKYVVSDVKADYKAWPAYKSEVAKAHKTLYSEYNFIPEDIKVLR